MTNAKCLAGALFVGLLAASFKACPKFALLGVCPSNSGALNRLLFTRVYTGVRVTLTHKVHKNRTKMTTGKASDAPIPICYSFLDTPLRNDIAAEACK